VDYAEEGGGWSINSFGAYAGGSEDERVVVGVVEEWEKVEWSTWTNEERKEAPKAGEKGLVISGDDLVLVVEEGLSVWRKEVVLEQISVGEVDIKLV